MSRRDVSWQYPSFPDAIFTTHIFLTLASHAQKYMALPMPRTVSLISASLLVPKQTAYRDLLSYLHVLFRYSSCIRFSYFVIFSSDVWSQFNEQILC